MKHIANIFGAHNRGVSHAYAAFSQYVSDHFSLQSDAEAPCLVRAIGSRYDGRRKHGVPKDLLTQNAITEPLHWTGGGYRANNESRLSSNATENALTYVPHTFFQNNAGFQGAGILVIQTFIVAPRILNMRVVFGADRCG